MIRHALAEGGVLLRRRWLLSGILALALAIPVALSGLGAAVSLWLAPLLRLEAEVVQVPVLLHPRMDGSQRAQWIAEQRAAHTDWTVEEIRPEELRQRLTTWFPYLGDLFRSEEPLNLPSLVEVSAPDPSELQELHEGPAVIAVGPTTSVNRLLGTAARLTTAAVSALSVILLFSAVILAATWVHLEIYRHAEEISVMRLVGATETTIRSPFLVVMGAVGAVAAAIACSGTLALVGWAGRGLNSLGLPGAHVPASVLALQAGLCVLAPLAAAATTLSLHARRTEKGARGVGRP